MASSEELDTPSLTTSVSSQNVAAALMVPAKPSSSKPPARMTRATSATQATPITFAPPAEAVRSAPIPTRAEGSHGILHVIAPFSAPIGKLANKSKSKGKGKVDRVPMVVDDSFEMEIDHPTAIEEEMEYIIPEVEPAEMLPPAVPDKSIASVSEEKSSTSAKPLAVIAKPTSPMQSYEGDTSMEYVDASLASSTVPFEMAQPAPQKEVKDSFSPRLTAQRIGTALAHSPAPPASIDPSLFNPQTPVAGRPETVNPLENDVDEEMPMRTPVRPQKALPPRNAAGQQSAPTAVIPSSLKMRTPPRQILAPVQNTVQLPTGLPGYTDEELKMPVIDLYRRIVDEIMSDTERHLRAKQADFRQRIEDGRRQIRDLGSE